MKTTVTIDLEKLSNTELEQIIYILDYDDNSQFFDGAYENEIKRRLRNGTLVPNYKGIPSDFDILVNEYNYELTHC